MSLPVDLVERIEREECILFVGPNASLPPAGHLGPPGPAILAAEIIDRLGYVPEDVTLPWAAQLYEIESGRRELEDFVARRLSDPRYCPTLTQHWVASLSFPIIISTAYDTLLDQLLRASSKRVPYNYILDAADLRSARRPYLIKLYGTAERAQTLLLTEDQHSALLEQGSEVIKHLEELSVRNSLLFIGYHPESTGFRQLFWRLRQGMRDKAPAAFIVQEHSLVKEAAFWRQRGLTTLMGTAEGFLAELANELARRQGRDVPAPPELALPPRMDQVTRQQLDQLVIKVLRQIGITPSLESAQQLSGVENNLDYIDQLAAEYEQVSTVRGDGNKAQPRAGTDDPMNQAQISLQLGRAAWTRRNYDQAREQFEEAIRKAPEYVEAYFSLHSLLAEVGNNEASLAYYKEAIALTPDRTWLPRGYVINKVLGTGRLGINYRVRDIPNDQELSVTILWESFARNREALDLYAGRMASLEHPRIPHFIQRGWFGGHHFLAWDYIDGKSLDQHLKQRPLTVGEALSLLEQVAEALEYAHEQGVIHRGLNPFVVILSSDRGASVIHFDEASLFPPTPGIVSQHADDIYYLAPEQRAGEPAAAANDIYSLGTLAYHLFTGRPPGVGTYVQPSASNPEVDEALDVLIDKARAIDPSQRYSSMTDLRREIQRLAQVDLAGGPYFITQTTRRFLRLLTRGVERLSGKRGLLVSLSLVLFFGMVEAWVRWPPLIFLGRFLILLWLNVSTASLLSNLRVRDMARETGLGSLIYSGRGLGAIFGFLVTLWELWNTQWDPESVVGWQNPAGLARLSLSQPGGSFIPFALTAAILALGLTFVMLLTLRGAGRLTQHYWRGFSSGFYVTFLLWCILLILLTVFPLTYSILQVETAATGAQWI